MSERVRSQLTVRTIVRWPRLFAKLLKWFLRHSHSMKQRGTFPCSPIEESTESRCNALDVRFRSALLSIDRRAAEIFQVGDLDARDVDALVGDFDSWVARESLLDTTVEAQQRWRIYLLGCAFGRWIQSKESVRRASVDEILARGLAIVPPMTAASSKAVDVLVDDPGDSADIAAALSRCADQHQRAFHETEARIWCRSEAFQAHVRQYSKSRRKAPIYWQLATPSASYSVWLYIHAFTKDTLFRVQNDYVAPKLAHEERQLETAARRGTDRARRRAAQGASRRRRPSSRNCAPCSTR